jgi:hypothetical protein
MKPCCSSWAFGHHNSCSFTTIILPSFLHTKPREEECMLTLPNFFLTKKNLPCRAALHKGCPKHHGHKGDPGVTSGTCGADGEKTQVILVWVRVRPWAVRSSWHEDYRMFKNTSIGGVSKDMTIWVGRCPGTEPWNSSGLGVALGTAEV